VFMERLEVGLPGPIACNGDSCNVTLATDRGRQISG
jgi:hypothetical protein